MTLSSTEQVLLNFMRSKGYDIDVPIDDMWKRLVLEHGNPDHQFVVRTAQQYVGAFVSRVNRKQDEYEIVPGELKRTYRVQLKEKK